MPALSLSLGLVLLSLVGWRNSTAFSGSVVNGRRRHNRMNGGRLQKETEVESKDVSGRQTVPGDSCVSLCS